MYLYKIGGKLVKSSVPIEGETKLNIDYEALTLEQKMFMRDVSNGVVIIDTGKRDAYVAECDNKLREAQFEKLSEIYDGMLSANIAAKNTEFSCSSSDRQNMRDALNVINSGIESMPWRDVTGTSITFTAAEYKEMIQRLFARGHALNGIKHAHEVALLGLSGDAIVGYDVTTGWPEQ